MTENTSSTKILIIEDEIAIAEGLIDLCNVNGYVVKHCADGESGLAEALTGQYNLVLLDLMLPQISGYELLDYIVSMGTPVIIISAMGQVKDRIRGLKKGADDYLSKPFQIGELVGKLTDEFREQHPAVPWRQIKAMRNIVAHSYGTVDPEITWEIITDDIPALKKYCEVIITSQE